MITHRRGRSIEVLQVTLLGDLRIGIIPLVVKVLIRLTIAWVSWDLSRKVYSCTLRREHGNSSDIVLKDDWLAGFEIVIGCIAIAAGRSHIDRKEVVVRLLIGVVMREKE
jgi:hypothetical protein